MVRKNTRDIDVTGDSAALGGGGRPVFLLALTASRQPKERLDDGDLLGIFNITAFEGFG